MDFPPQLFELEENVYTLPGAVLFPGFHFCPTNPELAFLLKSKNMNQNLLLLSFIRDIDVYGYQCLPGELLKQCFPTGEQVLYFFCPVTKKYTSGSRIKRSCEAGNWRITGQDREYCGMLMRTLVFYDSQHKKTSWIMHEYRLDDKEMSEKKKNNTHRFSKVDFVLCKLYEKSEPGGKDSSHLAGDALRERELEYCDYRHNILIVPGSLNYRQSGSEVLLVKTSATDKSLMSSADNDDNCPNSPDIMGNIDKDIALEVVDCINVPDPLFLQVKTTDQEMCVSTYENECKACEASHSAIDDKLNGFAESQSFIANQPGSSGVQIPPQRWQARQDVAFKIKEDETMDPFYSSCLQGQTTNQESLQQQMYMSSFDYECKACEPSAWAIDEKLEAFAELPCFTANQPGPSGVQISSQRCQAWQDATLQKEENETMDTLHLSFLQGQTMNQGLSQWQTGMSSIEYGCSMYGAPSPLATDWDLQAFPEPPWFPAICDGRCLSDINIDEFGWPGYSTT